MKKTCFIKKYLIVSIVAIAAMLTLLSGCKNSEEFDADVVLEGGTGKASIQSAHIVAENGSMTATIVWSSKNYDYMIVDGEKYYCVNTEGNSTFEIPVKALNEPIEVIADTVAMSKPHEIEYEITFSRNEKNIAADNGATDKNDNSLTEKGVSAFGSLSKEDEKWLSLQNITSELPLKYAKRFRVLYLNESPLVIINNAQCYLITEKASDELKDDFSDIPEDITIIPSDVNNIYVAGTGSMDYFATLDSLSNVGFTSLTEDNWDIDSVKEKMKAGDMEYAGKYSAPDYELLLSKGCDLVVENTMVSHSPEVLDKLKELNLPTIVDYSSYEDDPLGRMEWIKLYGTLLGKNEKAEEIFNEKIESVNNGFSDTAVKVAYFYINSNGAVVVRKNQDYVAKMISMAGGKYALSESRDYDGTGGMNIQVESFFEAVSDCD